MKTVFPNILGPDALRPLFSTDQDLYSIQEKEKDLEGSNIPCTGYFLK